MMEPAIGTLLPTFFRRRQFVSYEAADIEHRHGQDVAVAWTIFRLNWLFLALLLAIFDLALLLTDFRIRPLGYLGVLAVAAMYGISGHLNARSAQCAKPRLFSCLIGFAQATLGLSILTSLTYIATAANLPLQDAALLAIDRALGFDFRHFLTFVDCREWLIHILSFGYRAISWMIQVIIVALPLTGYCRRTAEFILALMLALAVTCCITIAVPAIGAYHALGLVPSDYLHISPGGYYDTAREMPLIRDGSLRLLDLSKFVGVVTFPSFHAASAILYGWALWPWRWFRPVNIFINAAMLVATPIGGGHFLIDVLAGIAVAILAIYGAQSAHRLGSVDGAPISQTVSRLLAPPIRPFLKRS
ncbi:phosphatase PAP2 family protein [Bradyrhizobium sp. STM 3557]|uniref:phosphatase PAP2 family protein n=1 Tax=Bradyrhizobium sp. STM 3557 TaxID=578920 RepID=UPI003890C46C